MVLDKVAIGGTGLVCLVLEFRYKGMLLSFEKREDRPRKSSSVKIALVMFGNWCRCARFEEWGRVSRALKVAQPFVNLSWFRHMKRKLVLMS